MPDVSPVLPQSGAGEIFVTVNSGYNGQSQRRDRGSDAGSSTGYSTGEERAAFVAASARRFGAWLRKLRGSRNQAQIAAMIPKMTQGRISGIERGKVIVSSEIACELADALEIADVLALVEAGYIRSLSRETAAIAVDIETLSERDKSLIAGLVAQMLRNRSG